MSPTLYYAVQFQQDVIAIIPWFLYYMYYLSTCIKDLFKSFQNFFVFFCDAVKKDQIFPSKVCHFQYDHKLLFSREWGTLEVAKR